jgi:hypothetical protein
MPLTNNNLTSALLGLMRSRRSSSAETALATSFAPERKMASLRQREAQFADFGAVVKLKAQSGLSVDSLENWHRFWRDNAAIPFAKAPLSWDGYWRSKAELQANLAGIPLLYH